jgi:type IV secretory pathway VirB3-like protein
MNAPPLLRSECRIGEVAQDRAQAPGIARQSLARRRKHVRRVVLDRDAGARKRVEHRLRDHAVTAADVKNLDRGVAPERHRRDHARDDRRALGAAFYIVGDPGAHVVGGIPVMVMVVTMMMVVVIMAMIMMMMTMVVAVVVRIVRHVLLRSRQFITSNRRRSMLTAARNAPTHPRQAARSQ